MVRRFLNLIGKEIRGLHEAAYLLGFFALLSQILALLRDRLFAHSFGAGPTLDIYYAAFRIPDFIFVSVASLVSFSVIIPFLVQELDVSKDRARQFLSQVFSAFSLSILAVSVVAFFLVPFLIPILYPGFAGTEAAAELTVLIRILLVQPIVLGISGFLASITQVYQRFVAYAASPILYNLGIIIGVLFLYPSLGIPGLGYGVVLGALLHLALQLGVSWKNNLVPRFLPRFSKKEVLRVVRISLPRALTLSAHQLALIFLVGLASLFGVGSVAIFSLAFNLQSVPLTIVGMSYAVAAFPTLSRLFARGESDTFCSQMITAARHILFWSIPATVLFIVLRAHIVRVILGSGEFGWIETRLTAAGLALFAVSLAAQGLVLLLVRGYYAAGRTKVPLIINTLSSGVIIASAFGLSWLFDTAPLWRYFIESLLRVEGIEGVKVLMLPLAYSLGVIVNVIALWVLFERDFKSLWRSVERMVFQVFSAAVVMGFVTHTALRALDEFFDVQTLPGVFGQGFVAGVIGIVVGVALLLVLENNEIKEIWHAVHRKVWRVPRVGMEEHGEL